MEIVLAQNNTHENNTIKIAVSYQKTKMAL